MFAPSAGTKVHSAQARMLSVAQVKSLLKPTRRMEMLPATYHLEYYFSPLNYININIHLNTLYLQARVP